MAALLSILVALLGIAGNLVLLFAVAFLIGRIAAWCDHRRDASARNEDCPRCQGFPCGCVPPFRAPRSALRLLLWPILWWGFAGAPLYCASEPFDPPPALALDLSRVSADDIARTVRHLQVIVRASEERALSLQHELEVEHTAHVTALAESGKVQTALDAANDRAAKAEADAAVQRKWKWRWVWTWTGTVALVAAFFVARQYFPLLKAL